MEWNVYYGSWYLKRIEKYNVFQHAGFAEDVRKAYAENREDFEKFSKRLRGALFRYFAGKCEWEIVISSWVSGDRIKQLKTDIYEQVMLNWGQFSRYVWDSLHSEDEA